MGLKAFRTCGRAGCPALIKEGSHCEKHRQQAEQREYETKKNDPVWCMYLHPRWKKFREWFLRLNPICQRVIDGKQCERIADTVHHLISPRKRPDLFIDAENVKAVCRAHHHHGEGAQPGEVYVQSDMKLSLGGIV